MTDELPHPNQPRISVTHIGYEVHCNEHGVVGYVEAKTEALALAEEHRKSHRGNG